MDIYTYISITVDATFKIIHIQCALWKYLNLRTSIIGPVDHKHKFNVRNMQ